MYTNNRFELVFPYRVHFGTRALSPVSLTMVSHVFGQLHLARLFRRAFFRQPRASAHLLRGQQRVAKNEQHIVLVEWVLIEEG